MTTTALSEIEVLERQLERANDRIAQLEAVIKTIIEIGEDAQ